MSSVGYAEIALLVFVILVVAIIFLSGLHILKEWERAIVLTLGRFAGIKGPGIIFVMPIVSRIQKVSTRIQAVAFKTEASFTQDNVPVNIDAVMYFQIVDPKKVVLNIENYITGTNLAAQTTIREVVGRYTFDEVLSEREKIGGAAREIIDEKTEHWGVKVSAVEIRDVQVLRYDFKEAVLMVQKEFADKAAAVPGTERAGRLTYSLNLRSSVKYLRTVPKSFFDPVPGVDSAIIKITPKPLHNTIPIEFADGVIRRLFSSRRKKIKTVYPNAPEKYGDRRAETLSMKEFMELCTSLHEITAL